MQTCPGKQDIELRHTTASQQIVRQLPSQVAALTVILAGAAVSIINQSQQDLGDACRISTAHRIIERGTSL